MKANSKFRKCNLAVFASGAGSNFINIYNHIDIGEIFGKINLFISNNPNCKATLFAKEKKINCKIVNKSRFSNHEIDDVMIENLDFYEIDLIILAGYMKKIPQKVVDKYLGRILNIHPSLLPKFGGKGFYGIKVHEAVINSKEQQTGITIHLVDHDYDTGNIIYQEKIDVLRTDSAVSLGKRVLELEHKNYPKVI